MNTKRIEKLSTKEMSQIRGGEGRWVNIEGEWYWIGSRDLRSDFTPPPSPPNS